MDYIGDSVVNLTLVSRGFWLGSGTNLAENPCKVVCLFVCAFVSVFLSFVFHGTDPYSFSSKLSNKVIEHVSLYQCVVLLSYN